jgi:hypothetical protein
MNLYQVFNFSHSLTVKISKGIFPHVFASVNSSIEILGRIAPLIYFDLVVLTNLTSCSSY